MTNSSYRDPWVKKAKWLTQALIVSGALNVGLLSTFIYFTLSEGKRAISGDLTAERIIKTESAKKMGLEELIAKYSFLSYEDLVYRLVSADHVESGYTRRDLSLACLVTFHHFNLERALGGFAFQRRELTFQSPQTGAQEKISVFPGLASYQYDAILSYAKTEKWPLTSEGLFLELGKEKTPRDPTLLEAFYLTPEFHFLELLFTKTGIPLKKEHLIALIGEGSWEQISSAAMTLKKSSQFTPELRRAFLLDLGKGGSKLAGKILMQTDRDFCLRMFDDQEIISFCDLLGDKASPSFLKELLQSPRSDAVWQKAAALLYEQAAEEVPKTLNLESARLRFIDLKDPSPIAPKEAPTPPPASSGRVKTYRVVSGDSLWKIARDHRTTVQAIREENELHSDQLKVGQALRIR